ncbi:Protein translocase subunit YajC [hydrothermal vent metagenome]|uniref:Protein translocase subunit YajC n=1 Tax=hydrothermal vent metagenome TaxID=652676 RepID=A0A3B0WLJ8_9ZZZZ
MSFFISDALAEGGAAAQGDPITALLFPVGLLVLFYFFLIRPQSKRAKEQKAMVAALGKGDEVLTQSGILGKIMKISDSFISVEISNNVVIVVQKSAVGSLMPKGTIKEQNK